MLVAALILPTAAGLGAAFPLALSTIAGDARAAVKRLGTAYAINTIGAVAGSLAAGFVLISMLGLQHTLELVSALLIVTALVVLGWGTLGKTAQIVNGTALVLAVVTLAWSPPWDRALLASGLYLYAPYVPKGLPLEPLVEHPGVRRRRVTRVEQPASAGRRHELGPSGELARLGESEG